MKAVTSSVIFPDEDEGVDTDVILVLVPSVLLIWLVEGNGEIVDSLEYNDLVCVLFPGTVVLWDPEVEVINGVVVFLYVTEDDCKLVEDGSVATMVVPAVLSDKDVVTVSDNVLVPVTEVLVGTFDDKEVVCEAVDKVEYTDERNEVDTDGCISGVTNIVVVIFAVESVGIADVVVYDVVLWEEVLCIELLDTLDEVSLSVECAVERVVAFG